MIKPALAFTAVGKVELLDMELPAPEGGEVLIRTEFSAISPGTELRCLAGLQPGSVAWPFIPGYALVGVVEAVGKGVGLPLGARVFASGTKKSSLNIQWGGQVSYAVTEESLVYPVASGCKADHAALAKMVAIASRGVTLTNPVPGTKVAVVGLGPIGLLSARLFAHAGADIVGVDVSDQRLMIPRAGGLRTVLVTSSVAEAVGSVFPGGADLVVDATGSAPVLVESMKALRGVPWGETDVQGPTLVIQGSYPSDFALPYQEAFSKELRLVLPRDCRPGDVSRALALIATGAIRVDDLITWSGPPALAQEVYDSLKSDRTKVTAVFDWSL